MVIAGDLPTVGDDLELIGLAVGIGIFQTRNVRTLGDIEPPIAVIHPDRLMQSVREPLELIGGEIIAKRIFDHPYLAAP